MQKKGEQLTCATNIRQSQQQTSSTHETITTQRNKSTQKHTIIELKQMQYMMIHGLVANSRVNCVQVVIGPDEGERRPSQQPKSKWC